MIIKQLLKYYLLIACIGIFGAMKPAELVNFLERERYAVDSAGLPITSTTDTKGFTPPFHNSLITFGYHVQENPDEVKEIAKIISYELLDDLDQVTTLYESNGDHPADIKLMRDAIKAVLKEKSMLDTTY